MLCTDPPYSVLLFLHVFGYPMTDSSLNAAHPTPQRDAFTSRFGVIAATLGSAVGLGNIWKFPYLTGANGGAGFLVVYLIATLLIALPVMIAEITLGRTARANAIGTLKTLAPRGQPWWLIGAAGTLAAFLILAFYTVVAGWVFAYTAHALTGQLDASTPEAAKNAFNSLTHSPWHVLIWQWVVLALTGGIILFGVSKGIEAVTKRLMPILFLLLLAIGIRSLTLPGASAGLAFLFTPDFSKITASVILTAMGLAFFKLSIGIGTMMTYGSYFRDDQNIPATAVRVMFADLAVSMLAGIAIFPAVFAFGFEPSAGPSLLFITLPAVFAGMPAGGVFLALFFVLTSIAALGAMLSILEVPVAALCEERKWSRRRATVVCLILLALVGATAALSDTWLAAVRPFGMSFFDLYDYLSSNILMPIGGIGLCLFVGWNWGKTRFAAALSNQGQLANLRTIDVLFFLARWISPLLVGWVMLKSLGVL